MIDDVKIVAIFAILYWTNAIQLLKALGEVGRRLETAFAGNGGQGNFLVGQQHAAGTFETYLKGECDRCQASDVHYPLP